MNTPNAVAANAATISHLLDVYPYLPFKPESARACI